MSKIEIIPVKGVGKFLDFCKVPRVIYKGMKGFAPCLDAERWTLYAHSLNPHYKLVDSQAWIAKRDGRLAGRIMAQVYKDGIVPVGASPFQFGCVESVDDPEVLKALLSKAEDWLREKGAKKIHGPFSPSVNSECGLLVDGFDATPMIFMPWNPAYLPALMDKVGYRKARDLISYRYDIKPDDRFDKPGVLARPEWQKRVKIRTIDLKTIAEEAKTLVDIFNDAWSQNWGFVPFTYEEFMSTADGMKLVMPEDGGFLIELDGQAVAFGVVLPNLHEITNDLDGKLFPLGLPKVVSRARKHGYKTGRLALFGIRQALHRKAVGGVVILALIEEMRRRGLRYNDLQHVEFGWVLEDNEGMRRPIELFGSKVDKIHRIYEKDLAA
ncbi:MAG TPA: hypothetical protein VGG12_03225 [Methylovirgula sp.]|jgi:hypothetical protein